MVLAPQAMQLDTDPPPTMAMLSQERQGGGGAPTTQGKEGMKEARGDQARQLASLQGDGLDEGWEKIQAQPENPPGHSSSAAASSGAASGLAQRTGPLVTRVPIATVQPPPGSLGPVMPEVRRILIVLKCGKEVGIVCQQKKKEGTCFWQLEANGRREERYAAGGGHPDTRTGN